MNINIKLWGQLRQIANTQMLSISLPENASISDAIIKLANEESYNLKDYLMTENNQLKESNLIFLNDKQASLVEHLKDNDFLTIMSPIAGG